MHVILGMLSGLALIMGPVIMLFLKAVAEDENTSISSSHVFDIIAAGFAIIAIVLGLYRWRSKLPKFSIGVGLGISFGLIHFLVFSLQQFTLA